ncbi:fasciclin domain-containing protein, partial [Sinomicrobium weinanense]
GLDLQEDEPYDYHVLDPEIDMTASEFLYLSRQDTLFQLMQQGIEYAGLTEEYSKPDRTFLFLANEAILRYNVDGTVNEDCYFGYHKVNGEPAAGWEDYAVEDVRDFFLYHIIEGSYSYDNLTPENTEVATLLNSENNKAYMKIMNARNSKLRVNDIPFTPRFIEARTSNIQSTNGIIHVFNGFIEPVP